MSDEKEAGDFSFSIVHEADGRKVVRVNDGGTEVIAGDQSPSRQGEAIHRQSVAAEESSPEAVAEYEEILYEDPDYPQVLEKMRELAVHVDVEDADLINRSHKHFVENYREIKRLMALQEVDEPRRREAERLKEAIREEREAHGGRDTGRSTALLEKLSSYYGGGSR